MTISTRQLGKSADYCVVVGLGKKVDHGVVAAIRRDEDLLRLVGMKILPLGTEYTGVIGYLNVLIRQHS